jgi:hypothetical protein
MNRTFALSLLASAALLTACGGGGGGSESASAAPTPSTSTTNPGTSSAPVSRAMVVSLATLDLRATDVLAQTASNRTMVSAVTDFLKSKLFDATSIIAGPAYASGLPSLKVGSNMGFTNKIRDGQLVSLKAKLKGSGKDKDKELTCDDTNAEVKIHKIWGVNPGKGHMLARMTVPASLSEDCTVSYKQADFVVTGDGAALEIDASTEQIVDVIAAGDHAFNSSSSTLLVVQTGLNSAGRPEYVIRALDVNDDNTATITDLTSRNVPISAFRGAVAYDGTNLVAIPNAGLRTDAVLVFTRGSTAFRVISAQNGPDPVPSIGYHAVFLNANGKFTWNWINGNFKELDLANGTYFQSAMQRNDQPIAMYGAVGRYNQHLMSDRCVVWNVDTNESVALSNTDKDYIGGEIQYSRLDGQYAYCINGQGNLHSRMDAATGNVTRFDLDRLGVLALKDPRGAIKATVYANETMVEVANTANSDKMFVELDFTTGEMHHRGVIEAGDRKVTDLIPIGN